MRQKMQQRGKEGRKLGFGAFCPSGQLVVSIALGLQLRQYGRHGIIDT